MTVTIKPTLTQFDVTVTLTGIDTGRAYSEGVVTVRIPAIGADKAEEIGRALGQAIIDTSDRFVAWPVVRQPVKAQAVNPEVEPDTDEQVGPREAYLRMRAKSEGFPITASDVDHERHVDNCKACQEQEEDRRNQYQHERRLENSRHELLGFLYQIQDTLKALGNWKAADKPLPPTQEFVEKLTAAARKTSSAYQRAMKS
ncbi:hypothetical protein ACFP2T_16320 [Plantactinospora solaniradicis]|uniref:Uncharacterized protein n=1 Tax=Plantactinospora solaniradicis TaxID=1723736 RepID=A0ABW1K931_9ACTN